MLWNSNTIINLEARARASLWFEGLIAGCLRSTPPRIPKGILLYQNGKRFLMGCQDTRYKLPKDGPSTAPPSFSACLLISWRTFIFFWKEISFAFAGISETRSSPSEKQARHQPLARGVSNKDGKGSEPGLCFQIFMRFFSGGLIEAWSGWLWEIATNLTVGISFQSWPLCKGKGRTCNRV